MFAFGIVVAAAAAVDAVATVTVALPAADTHTHTHTCVCIFVGLLKYLYNVVVAGGSCQRSFSANWFCYSPQKPACALGVVYIS